MHLKSVQTIIGALAIAVTLATLACNEIQVWSGSPGGWGTASQVTYNQPDITKFGSAVHEEVDYFEWSFGSPVQKYRIKKSDVCGTKTPPPHTGTRSLMDKAADKNRDVRIKVSGGTIKEFALQ